ncbi:MAG: HAMP domain-containing protein [Nitrospira sp.]|nr:HAMP domain-containing protein [Nitrospira sp.]
MTYERFLGTGISVGVRTKLVLSTAAILIVACLFLGWLFSRQQVRSATESLVQSGTLLAQHLAGMGRVSILAGDTYRLEELAQEILAVSPVTYVAILSPSGDLHTGYGKAEWQQQFSTPSTGRRQFSVTKLVSQSMAETVEPIINGIRLNSTGPVLRSTIDFSPSELLSLLGGYELPIFYDLLVQVPRQSHTGLWDPALELTLAERPSRLEQTQKLTSKSPSLVEIGLSTSDLQQNLRRLLWQAVLITVNTLIGGICITVLLARRMTVPLQALTSAAMKLGAGETPPPLVIHAQDEIGTLTRVFNSMATTLQTREHELRELAQTLEERVKIRTQELAAANAKLQELDRRKSIFVSTASHELRTPLTSMKVHLANLRDGIDGAVTADQRASLLRVEANLSRLRLLIEELLDLSQIEMGQTTLRLEPVELASVIAKTIEDLHPFTTEHSVKIVISLPTDLPRVSADPEKLRQILLNLLHNAVKFSPMDTVVDLNVTRLSSGNILISVRDVGPGIAPDDIDKVFQPFYRAPTTHKKTKGTGLGLAIAKLLVELHQSQLAVETVPGRGSCFYFTLQAMTPARLTYTDPIASRLPVHQRI